MLAEPLPHEILDLASEGVVTRALGDDESLHDLSAQGIRHAYLQTDAVANVLTGCAFVVAFIRARGAERHRTAWIIARIGVMPMPPATKI